MDQPEVAPASPGAQRPRRRWRMLGLVLALLAVLVGFAPRLLAPWARGRIERELEARLALDASLESLSASWSGSTRLAGLALDDASGAQVLSVAELRADLGLLALLSREVVLEGELAGLELALARDAEGRWNALDWPRPAPGGGGGGGGAPASEPSALPELRIDFALREVRVRIEDARSGSWLLGPLSGRLTIPSLAEPAQLTLESPLVQPGRGRGGLRLEANLRWNSQGRIEPLVLDGSAQVALEGLLLGPLCEMAGPIDGLERCDGRADGTLALALSARAPETGGPEWSARAELGLAELELALRDAERPQSPLEWSEPEARVDLSARLDPRGGALELEHVTIASSTLAGELHGRLQGLALTPAPAAERRVVAESLACQLTYVPDRVGALLAHYVPASLTGSEPQPLSLAYAGPLTGLTEPSALATVHVETDLTLGRLAAAGFETRGDVHLVLDRGRAKLAGALDLNGGKVVLDGELGLAEQEETPSRVTLELTGVKAAGALAPLLARVHPAFAAAKAAKNGSIEGLITSQLELSLPGALDLERIRLGEGGLDWKQLSGKGSFTLKRAALRGSAFFDQLAGLLGFDPQGEWNLSTLAFALDAGRLTYDKPWTWVLGGARTSFSGSIGLDQSLDLAWTIPLEEGFLKKQSLPLELAGQKLAIPLGGSLLHPRLDLEPAVAELAKSALRQELDRRKDEAKDELLDKVGKEVGDLLGGLEGAQPKQLLEEADRLWEQGQQAEARPLYRRLEKDHKLTSVYLLNRERIHARAKD